MSFFKDTHITLESSSDIHDICRPIFDAFGINYFRYLRVYQDGSRICLSSNPNWINHFFDNKLYEEAWFDCKPITEYKAGKTIWDAKAQNEDNQVGRDGRMFFNMHHGVTITRKPIDETYCEFFGFTTTKENYAINDLYSTSEDLIHRFIFYFLDKAKFLIEKAEKTKIIIPELTQVYTGNNAETTCFSTEKINQFLNDTNISKYWLNNSTYLTRREVEVISLCSKGMSMKEIARLLESSPRTIESHILNCRQKLKCKNITELISLCINMDLIKF